MEQNGEWVRLPCKAGATVYCLDNYCKDGDAVCKIRGQKINVVSRKVKTVEEILIMIADHRFGTTVFSRRADAESAARKAKTYRFSHYEEV